MSMTTSAPLMRIKTEGAIPSVKGRPASGPSLTLNAERRSGALYYFAAICSRPGIGLNQRKDHFGRMACIDSTCSIQISAFNWSTFPSPIGQIDRIVREIVTACTMPKRVSNEQQCALQLKNCTVVLFNVEPVPFFRYKFG
jgi:hypothetical protein